MKIKDFKLDYICICKQETGERIYEGNFNELPKGLMNKKIVYLKNCYCEIK